MSSVFKRGIRKLFRLAGFTISPIKKGNLYSNIIDATVRFPDLIDKDATVQYSELRGKISVGPGSLINKVLFDGNISIGRNTTVNGPGTEFYAIQHPITVGSFCSIARGTAVQEHNHNLKSITTYFIKYRVFKEEYGTDVISKGPITIGNDVWIGTQCVILTGVTIGNGAVVAANSVVSMDVPPYAIVGGSPAKILGYRFSEEIIEHLQKLSWWNWPTEKILANYELFHQDLSMEMLNRIEENLGVKDEFKQLNG